MREKYENIYLQLHLRVEYRVLKRTQLMKNAKTHSITNNWC